MKLYFWRTSKKSRNEMFCIRIYVRTQCRDKYRGKIERSRVNKLKGTIVNEGESRIKQMVKLCERVPKGGRVVERAKRDTRKRLQIITLRCDGRNTRQLNYCYCRCFPSFTFTRSTHGISCLQRKIFLFSKIQLCIAMQSSSEEGTICIFLMAKFD